MTLQSLSTLDRNTANNVLAAAALAAAPNHGMGEFSIVKSYEREVAAVLAEIRAELGFRDGPLPPRAQAQLDDYISREIDASIFVTDDQAAKALSRAGQHGRLSPALYKLEQPTVFSERFYPFGLKKKTIEAAVHSPDDFQHLMTDGVYDESREDMSLFMKRQAPSGGKDQHWLMVHTHRVGRKLVAQSAWRIYPDDVDFRTASKPVEVLKAFAEVFGVPIRVGKQEAKFVDSESFLGEKEAQVAMASGIGLAADLFLSFSHRRTETTLLTVGIAYCIDMNKYKKAMRQRGFSV